MARYQRPPDPRDPESEFYQEKRRSLRLDDREKTPWLWLGLGVLATLLGIALAAFLVAAFLIRDPLATTLPTPTIIRLTAPPAAASSPTAPLPTASPIPTFTPQPTPDLSVAPESITVGFYARVTNTEDIGVSLRGGPSTDNVRLQLVPEDTIALVIAGPEEGSGYVWWQVLLEEGDQGWVAGDFIVPAAAPLTEAEE